MPTITETVHHSSGTYVEGSVLPADHPLVKSAPHLFIADDDAPVVESATAAPGEKRSVKRPARKA